MNTDKPFDLKTRLDNQSHITTSHFEQALHCMPWLNSTKIR